LSQIKFDTQNISEKLPELSTNQLNELDFGVIGFNPDGIVKVYNTLESEMAGLSIENVIDEDLFNTIAPCMNNFMVAQKFEDAIDDSANLDETMDYVLTLKMKPTRVKLRLVSNPSQPLNYILIQR
jgi:photoactive yellow protein